MVYKYMLIFLGAAVPWLEVIAVVPAGIVWGLTPFLVMVVAFMGNMLSVLVVIFGFDQLKRWYVRRREAKGKESSKGSRRAVVFFHKYGLAGLGLLGPLLIGTHIAAFIGMALGASKRAMSIWIGVGIAVWVAIFGITTALGFDFFTQSI
ncbi:small multi-drug export protein [Lentibacillus cibarius]|nr:small multi-drug export protein [Lentibacillus cibarius]